MCCEGSGLSWQLVSWHVRANGRERQVLHGLTGHVRPGQVMAVMGPSGSGKTTLLDALAMRKTLGRLEGRVRVHGRERNDGVFQRASAYVPHEDAFLPTLTVLETMRYHAEMRVPQSPGGQERDARVAATLRLVGLVQAEGTLVGGLLPGGLSLRGLSGGEKKRLSIAVAMLPEPPIVFADEPTSGLDALASLKVLQALKAVADGGMIVLVTVHQPRGAVWELFDRLYLLSEGHLMFTGEASRAASWFKELGYGVPEDGGGGSTSPADWLLDLVTVGFDKGALEHRCCTSLKEVAEASCKFNSSEYMARVNAEVAMACSGAVASSAPWPRGSRGDGSPGRVGAHVRTLFWRHALNYWRNLGNVAARLCLAAASGLVVGLCYSGLRAADERDPRMVPDRLGALFLICIVLMISPNCTMSLFAADRRFYVAEAAARLYGPLAYYVPLAICELALNCTGALLFWGPVSLLSGMRNEGFLCGLLLCGLLQQCGSQIVSCSALLAPNQELAFVVSVAANIFSFITCGFLVRTSNLVACVRSLRFLSPVKLGFQALALNELAEREFSASLQLEDLRGALREVGAGAAWDGAGSQLGAAPWWLRQRSLRDAATRVLEEVLPCADPCVTGMVSSGREALECIGLDEPAAVWPAVLGLLAHSAALHALAWLCLSKLSRERR